MSIIQMKNELQYLSTLSNKKDSEVMLNVIANIVHNKYGIVTKQKAYNIAKSILNS